MYKCDGCGETAEEKWDFDLFNEGRWTRVPIDKDGNLAKYIEPADKNSMFMEFNAVTIKHYCPICSTKLENKDEILSTHWLQYYKIRVE